MSLASTIIDALGGTSRTAALMRAPPSTVHSLRKDCSPSRLDHLQRIAADEGFSLEELATAAGRLASQEAA